MRELRDRRMRVGGLGSVESWVRKWAPTPPAPRGESALTVRRVVEELTDDGYVD
jgi:hypothetical protein